MKSSPFSVGLFGSADAQAVLATSQSLSRPMAQLRGLDTVCKRASSSNSNGKNAKKPFTRGSYQGRSGNHPHPSPKEIPQLPGKPLPLGTVLTNTRVKVGIESPRTTRKEAVPITGSPFNLTVEASDLPMIKEEQVGKKEAESGSDAPVRANLRSFKNQWRRAP